ncbi:nickel pincer cofactor biosynthesis protein LarB [Roseibacillus persicicus]|uniref:1-(5-phosphoribosyl)-5-amino-4-imidazole-carboxylate carboxylase n=1 Tax=Roseibacillus persicicus TaxID=454148 RepID=A0A918TB70_9BACT|nr:nickel pincer cofactor biosynthesis protein LarB [Roseibacillus persicicus]GHC39905.1 1-(5-phosphoribosyl)-5-amino-4-imidazole-carboxylate carboxylase [Roseibacillus persicicus]
MNRDSIQQLLEQVAGGKMDIESAMSELVHLPFAELAHSTLDLHRELRQGSPEIIFGENKTPQQISDNLIRIHAAHGKALATRVGADKAAEILATWSPGLPAPSYQPSARCLTLGLGQAASPADGERYVAVVTAGTSDLAISDEAALTLQFLGHRFVQINDVGVAGLHRLFPHLEVLQKATCIIAIAGMEGALPSVLGGLLPGPIVAVPTSTGYGIARDGETALHAMLTSCASGISVVNIDNGFGAALFAHALLRQF